MKGLKAVMIISTIVAIAAVLSACERGYKAAMECGYGGTAIHTGTE